MSEQNASRRRFHWRLLYYFSTGHSAMTLDGLMPREERHPRNRRGNLRGRHSDGAVSANDPGRVTPCLEAALRRVDEDSASRATSTASTRGWEPKRAKWAGSRNFHG